MHCAWDSLGTDRQLLPEAGPGTQHREASVGLGWTSGNPALRECNGMSGASRTCRWHVLCTHFHARGCHYPWCREAETVAWREEGMYSNSRAPEAEASPQSVWPRETSRCQRDHPRFPHLQALCPPRSCASAPRLTTGSPQSHLCGQHTATSGPNQTAGPHMLPSTGHDASLHPTHQPVLSNGSCSVLF